MEVEEGANFFISEISKDSELLSLFHNCESGQSIHEEIQIEFEPSDLKPEDNYNERGYTSDIETTNYKSKQLKKHKPIINKKEKMKSRKRTKLYIEMLENRVNELQTENEKLRKLNKINKEYIHRLNESEHHVTFLFIKINGYFVGRQQVFEKLDILNTEDKDNNERILEEMSCLRMRQGAYGKDRLKAINYYFKEMVEMLLPDIQKYLVKIATEKLDFFDKNYLQQGKSNNELEGWRKGLFDTIEEDGESEKLRAFILENEQKINNEVKIFAGMIERIYEMKCNLIEQGKVIEEVFDTAHEYLNPKQISKTLCYVDRYRFEKNISLENILYPIFERVAKESYFYEPNILFAKG